MIVRILDAVGISLFFVVPVLAQTSEDFARDAERVSACVQEVYALQAEGKEPEGGFTDALQACYAGTSLESYAQDIDTQQDVYVSVDFEDVFVDERARLRLQEVFDRIDVPVTFEESQRIAKCFADVRETHDFDGAPSVDAQRAFAQCYRGTAYEPLADVYEQIATRIDCSYDTLGIDRVREIVVTGSYAPRELEIVQKCIIERSARVSVGFGFLNVLMGLGVYNSMLYGLFLMQLPMVWMQRRRVDEWGVVVNRFTHTPIDLCMVRVLREGRIIATRVTDRLGRYIFFVDPGSYGLDVSKRQFAAPSGAQTPLPIAADDGIVRYHIALEPVEHIASASHALSRAWRLNIQSGAMYVLLAINALAFLILRNVQSFILLLIIVLMYGVFRRHVYARPAGYGRVLDGRGKPVARAVVRIFSQEFNKLADTAVTDRKGRYAFLVGSGEYYVTAEKDGKKAVSAIKRIDPQQRGWFDAEVVLP